MRQSLGSVLALLLLTAPLAAQSAPPACTAGGIPPQMREACALAVQTASAAQPQLGILLAGGNPTPGEAGAGGLRLGFLPRVSVGVGVNLASVEIPDVLGSGGQGTRGVLAPALAATATVGVFPGLSFAPGLGGVGAIDLVGGVSGVPLTGFAVDGFEGGSNPVAYALGARLGLLGESFIAPGLSASLMYRKLGELAYGDVCPAFERFAPGGSARVTSAECPVGGDRAEFGFDLTNWSARAVVGKHLLGLGAAAGIGYDRFDSQVALGARAPDDPGDPTTDFIRVGGASLESDRWSAFANLSYTLLVVSLAAEAGWMQGGDPVEGFSSLPTTFDAGDGTWFGNVSLRLRF